MTRNWTGILIAVIRQRSNVDMRRPYQPMPLPSVRSAGVDGKGEKMQTARNNRFFAGRIVKKANNCMKPGTELVRRDAATAGGCDRPRP
jgi:hypothetical protein